MLWVAALRLSSTNWTDHLQRIELLVMLGCLLGLALGWSAFSSGVARALGFLYTIIIVPWQLAHTIPVDGILWADRLRLLGEQIARNARIIAANRPVDDSILFITAMALLYWLISLIASYQLVRYRRPWMPLAVAGLAMVLIEYYHSFATRSSLLTALFLLLGLILIGRLHFLSRRMEWEADNVGIDAEAGFNISRGTLLTGVFLVLLAWNLPMMINALLPGTTEQQWVNVSWQGLRNRMSNMVASLQSPPTSAPSDFANVLGLGTGAIQGDDTVMLVSPLTENETGARYYWRGRSFDRYENGQWVNTMQELREVNPDELVFQYPFTSPRSEVEVRIQTAGLPSRVLYTPGQPDLFDRSGMAQVQPINEEEVDVVAVMAEPSLRPGDDYRVKGTVSVPTIRQLRDSPQVYPAWVRDTYLQLPEDMPVSIKALAEDLTAGMDNPYDKVQAITQYLRENIKYNVSVPSAPVDEDQIEWFLFVHKEGYCNYYATAEVLMLRSIDIPARLATGYAEGQSQQEGRYYVVQRKDSHAWPEVYFYGAGWVPFEPTVSQPEYVLAEGNDAALNSEEPDDRGLAGNLDRNLLQEREDRERPEAQDLSGAGAQQRLPLQWIALTSALLALGLLVFFWYRQQLLGKWSPFPVAVENLLRKRGAQAPLWLRAWSRYVQAAPIERMFAGIPWMVRIMGGRVDTSRTPGEQVSALLDLLPDGDQPAREVLEAYERAVYSAHSPDMEPARHANARLWRQVWRGWLKKHFGVEIELT